MTDETKAKISKFKNAMSIFYAGLKKIGLQVIGGLLMEKKDDLWVVSLTRVMTWTLFGHCLYIWSKAMTVAAPTTDEIAAAITAMRDVSQGELYTLWGFLGIAGVKVAGSQVASVVSAMKGGGSGEEDK